MGTLGKISVAVSFALIVALVAPQTIHAQRKQDPKAKQAADKDKSKSGTPVAVDDPLYNCKKARGRVSVSFKPDIELKDLISWAMGFTCKNFVYSSGIGGRTAKVTIIAPKKMTARQAWSVFLVALQTMGLTVVPKGNVLKIIEAAQSKKDALPIYRRGTPAATDQIVRLIIRPEHVSVEDLSIALNAVVSKEGSITTMSRAGALLVTDYGNHIHKMKQLIRELDRPMVGERIYMIRVRYADVTELAAKLTEMLGTKATRGAGASSKGRRGKKGKKKASRKVSADEVEAAIPSKIMADERTNALIILASEPAYLRVRALVRRLDVAVEVEGGGRIHVYDLENADAEELGNTLTSVISGIQQQQSASGRNKRKPARPAGATTGAPAFEGMVRVTHDKPTNSLVIVASVKDFLALREVIRKLDVPRRQVFIEAVILEVSVNTSREFGFSFHGGTDFDDGGIALAGLQHSNLQSLNVQSIAAQTGLIGGLIGPLLPGAQELLGTSIPSYGVLFQALATNSNVNVLSSPHILTTDNEEAEISVGENIPYQSSVSGLGGQSGGTGGFGFPIQSIQRQDVALTLKITPHVNASDMVRLEIDQEISDIADPDFEGNGPSWSKRTIKTTVVVKDQQSIVIGGLMSDRVTYSEAKIPLLGDIPILGYLFKYTKKATSKTNLLVLLTPYVIKDQMDIEEILQRKVRERAEFVRTFSTFATMEYKRNLDYRRKRGVVEEINRTVRMIEEEAELLREYENRQEYFPDGPIEYGEDELGSDTDSGGIATPATGESAAKAENTPPEDENKAPKRNKDK